MNFVVNMSKSGLGNKLKAVDALSIKLFIVCRSSNEAAMYIMKFIWNCSVFFVTAFSTS